MLAKEMPIPLYYQLRQQLQGMIQEGVLRPGDKIPAETELVNRYRISRMTVRQAIQGLVVDGLLSRTRPKGTFVNPPQIRSPLSWMTSLVEDIEAAGLTPATKVLTLRTIRAPEGILQRLQRPLHESVTLVEKVRLANDELVSFEIAYLPHHLGKQLSKKEVENKALLSILEDQHIDIGYGDFVIGASSMPSRVARGLACKAGIPALRVERTLFSATGVPIAYDNVFFRADRVAYSIRVRRPRERDPRVMFSLNRQVDQGTTR